MSELYFLPRQRSTVLPRGGVGFQEDSYSQTQILNWNKFFYRLREIVEILMHELNIIIKLIEW